MKTKYGKTIIICILIAILAVVVVGLATLAIHAAKQTDELSDEITDELNRARYFITDWYDEVFEVTKVAKTYNNELQLGSYTLTYENLRLRAVYPKGAREFKFDYVTHTEFFTQNGYVYGVLEYENNGRYQFLIH